MYLGGNYSSGERMTEDKLGIFCAIQIILYTVEKTLQN